MKYSIVIPTYNNVALLSRCLESVIASVNLEENEVIIIDNGSTDETASLLQNIRNHFGANIRIITNKENKGFCIATNQGMAVSNGDYIVWLNDDTIVTPGWIDRLESWIVTKNVFHPNVALVGPVSNNAAGSQSSESLRQGTVADIQKIVQDITSAHDPKSMPVQPPVEFLSGFCLMMTKEVYKTIGGIDEAFSPGGYCDNDFCLRAMRAGFGMVVATDTFVYHQGHTTLDREFPELSRGLKNWPVYAKKYRNTSGTKLLLLMRIKLDSQEQLDLYERMCDVNNNFVDGVIILDDRSELSSDKIRKPWGKKIVSYNNKAKKAGFDEIADRTFLLRTALEHKEYDWVVMLDHDECFAEGTTKSKLEKLMNPLNPAVHAYSFKMNHYWRSNDLIRDDNFWGMSFMVRMWKNGIFPPTLRPKLTDDDTGLHCGNRPMSIPQGAISTCNVFVDHYGYSDENSIERKLEFYKKTDNIPESFRQELLGLSSYDAVYDETNMRITKYSPYTLAANVLCKDELISVGRMLMNYDSCVDEWVISDTGSSDDTVQVLRDLGYNVTEKQFNNHFAEMRNDLIERSSSTYCMQLDPDELPDQETKNNLIYVLSKNPDIVVWSLRNIQKSGHCLVTQQPRVWKRSLGLKFSGRVHETLEKYLTMVRSELNRELRVAHNSNVMSTNTGFLCPDEDIDRKLKFYGALLEQEIKEDPQNAKAHLELALHYSNYDRNTEAVELLEKALKINPNYTAVRRELALIKLIEAYNAIAPCEGMEASPELRDAVIQMHNDLKKYVKMKVKVGSAKNAEEERQNTA